MRPPPKGTPPEAPTRPYALTPTQRDLYLDSVLQDDPSVYNLGFLVPLGPDLEPTLWQHAVAAVAHQESLFRVRFTTTDGELEQTEDPALAVSYQSVDLTDLDFRSTAPEEFLEERRREPLDLTRGPLFRSFLIRDRSGGYHAGLTTSHLVFDEFSAKELFQRISTAYGRIEKRASPRLATSPSFFRYVEESVPRFDAPECLRYWARTCREVVAPAFDTGHQPPAEDRNRVSRSILDAETVLAVKRFCLEHRFPLPAFFLSLYGALIRRYSNPEGALLLHSVAGYRPKELLSSLGCFYHVLPVLFPGGDAEQERSVSRQARELSLYRRRTGPHEHISAMALRRITGDLGTRCFFNYRLAGSPRVLGDSRRTTFLWDHPPNEVHLTCSEHGEELEMELRHNPTSFREARFLERLRQMIHVACRTDPAIGELEIVLEDERPVLSRLEIPQRPATQPEALVVELFECQAAQRPSAIAVVAEGTSLTYQELDLRANRTAYLLREMGAGPDRHVALALEPSLELVIALLGILKSGAAYVPIDPTLPDRRLRYLVDATDPVALIARSTTALRTSDQGVPTLFIEEDEDSLPGTPSPSPFNGHRSDHPAYVIHTSGSTGQPKGVIVTHGNLARLFSTTRDRFDFGPRDVWTLFHSASFDFSVWEFLGALLHGGRLVVVPKEVRRSPDDFLSLLEREGVTVLNQTPSAFAALVRADEQRHPEVKLSLRYVILGGEAVSLPSLRSWVRRRGCERPRLVNMYGITETTVHTTYRELAREEIETGSGSPIGVPLPDLSVRLLDRRQRPVPPGFPGELWVGGAGVARGYLGREDLTRERFVPDPAGGGRLYRSGDLGRLLADGDLEYLGRFDDQVKIRGFRIETGEVESALQDHPGIVQAAVIAEEDGSDDRRLAAYVVAAEGRRPTVADLLDHLRRQLPEYMVPSRVVFLSRLPLTANGKLDRTALPATDEARAEPGTEPVLPRTPTERRLAKIWEELLRVDRVGVHDRFFDLGGHSLAAIRLISRVRDGLGVQLPVCAVFQHPTVAELAATVQAEESCGEPLPEISSTPLPRDAPLPCSFSQERVWLLLQMVPESRAYEFLATLRFTGPVAVAVLERALTELVRRHEAYRTTFGEREGEPVQWVHPPWTVSLPVTDLRSVPAVWREAEAARAVTDAAAPPFDLSKLPLVRWSVIRLADDDLLLVHNEHHLSHDGWSFIIVLRELLEIYRAFSLGHASPLPDPPIQFADFAAWQRQWLPSVRDDQLEFWKRRLEGAPAVLPLPLDRPRPELQTFRGDALRVDLPETLTGELKEFCRRSEVTLTMALMAAFFALLHRYTGEDDLVVGSGVANRRFRQSEGIVGMIINNVALRCDLSQDPSARELAGRVRQVILDSLEHQDVPFHMVVDAVNPTRLAGVSPIFQAMLSSYDDEMPELELPGTRIRLDEGLNTGSAKFDLNVIAIQRPKEADDGSVASPTVSLIWEYNTDLFDSGTMERMLERYEAVLQEFVTAPEDPISALPILTPEERRTVVEARNGTRSEYPRDLSIHQVFRRQVERSPDAVAISCAGREISYRDLDAEAGRLARHLRRLGAGPGVPVGLLMDRSPESIVGMLAVLMAGGPYVPLDPAYPSQRLLYMQRDTGLTVLLTQRHLRERLPAFRGTMICLDDLPGLAEEDLPNLVEMDPPSLAENDPPSLAENDPPGLADEVGDPLPHVSAESLAYVMYTSGSTGEPKGVIVPHRAVVRLVQGQDYVTLDTTEVLLQLAPISFDAATFEIWGALLNGGRLVLPPPGPVSLKEIGKLIRQEGVTTLWLTAPLFHQMVDENLEGLRGVRQLLAGGDVLSPTHVRRALEGLPGCVVINGYGPTEGTTFTCCHRMTHADEVGDLVPIGRPIANTRAYVLDSHRNPVPAGVPGELYIGGDGLAQGYLNAPDLSDRRFVPNPLPEEPGDRLYRTGDRVRHRTDGGLDFLGRFDSQVKIRGFRVEPGEIEAALKTHPAVSEVAVVAREGIGGLAELVAYVSATEPTTSEDLERFLDDRLPAHLVPRRILFPKGLPRTSAGKLDRRKLREIEPPQTPEGFGFAAPDSATEHLICQAWSRILEVDEIDVNRNFFDLGGSSLTILRVHHRLSKTLGSQLAVADLFRYPTVRSLARALGSSEPDNSLLTDALERDSKRRRQRVRRNPSGPGA